MEEKKSVRYVARVGMAMLRNNLASEKNFTYKGVPYSIVNDSCALLDGIKLPQDKEESSSFNSTIAILIWEYAKKIGINSNGLYDIVSLDDCRPFVLWLKSGKFAQKKQSPSFFSRLAGYVKSSSSNSSLHEAERIVNEYENNENECAIPKLNILQPEILAEGEEPRVYEIENETDAHSFAKAFIDIYLINKDVLEKQIEIIREKMPNSLAERESLVKKITKMIKTI